MLPNIINTSTNFSCPLSPGVQFKVVEPSNFKLKDSNSLILTKNAILTMIVPSICPLIPPSPAVPTPPCTFVPSSAWFNFSTTAKVNGSFVLTQNSFITCVRPLGVANVGVNKLIPQICKLKHNVVVIPPVVIPTISTSVTNPTQTATTSSGSNSKNTSNDNNSTQTTDTNNSNKSTDTNASSKDNIKIVNSTTQPQNDSDDKKKDVADHEYMVCDYKNCDKTDDCDYYNASLEIINSSSHLRSNFQRDRVAEFAKVDTNFQQVSQNKTLFSDAAHHLISVHNCFTTKNDDNSLKYGNLIRLANFFEYDINSAINCILLPTYNTSTNSETRSAESKSINSFDGMSLSKAQWHSGGHSYTIDSETNQNILNDKIVLSKGFNKGVGFTNYKEYTNLELDDILKHYSENSSTCLLKNTTQRKNTFINKMDTLSRKIEKHLNDFANDPKYSFPFYVSRVAVEYAFNVPKASKIILIHNKNSNTYVSKFRLERFKTNNFSVNAIEKGSEAITSDEAFVSFCENIHYFFIDSSTNFIMPFSTVDDVKTFSQTVTLNELSPLEFINSTQNSILTFIQSNSVDYVAPAKSISYRLKKL